MTIEITTKEEPPHQSLASHIISSFTSPISSLGLGVSSPPEPLYTPAEVPLIKKKAKRLANTRLKQLLRAAERVHNEPPPPPGLGECCGSSCDPCVNDLWREELACWRERWGDGAVEKDGKEDGKQEEDGLKERERKMPGSFDW
ncbi:hypothetical protein FE257_010591 [Aspergillus nanangensis]|uniref:Oxidoreductase-like domain-containing protein n=1 Tax=Aspergillus nanangensis TaxID=2582783 RepID=A0AAD4GRZ3_ASPNN|nr:hypothetical protein FE257_010591 [Aspergillus nanangensis]